MWKLIEVYAQNVCSFRELNYKPVQGVTTLIFGDNRDNESQRSNGSGKSALIEAIAVGLTGSPLRKIKNEELINDQAEECFIELLFQNDSTHEVFQIDRKMYRKGSSEVSCCIETDGKKTPKAQPSVDGYNKYILEVLGLTKDELFNNFILSKHKYQNFLSCSDKEKKEIINRFSNGILVDQAIENIRLDKEPVTELLKKKELEYAGCTGRTDMLKEQIEQEETSKQEKAKSRNERIIEIDARITEKRSLLRDNGTRLNELTTELDQIKDVDARIQELENGDHTLEEFLAGINRHIPLVNKRPMTDWNTLIDAKKEQITKAEDSLGQWDKAFEGAESNLKNITDKQQALIAQYQQIDKSCKSELEDLDTELTSLDERYKLINSEFEQVKKIRSALSSGIEALKNKLAGVITCPSCGFEFLLAEHNFDVCRGKKEVSGKEEELTLLSLRMDGIQAEIGDIDQSQTGIRLQKREVKNRIDEWNDRKRNAQQEVSTAQHELDGIKRTQGQCVEAMNQLQKEVDGIVRQVFDEAFDLIDESYKSNERQKRVLQDDAKAIEGSIKTLEETINEIQKDSDTDLLVTLKKSLAGYREKSALLLADKSALEEEIDTFSKQEQSFVEFKTYLANTKIEALSKITNEFLEEIGSDIRIKFSGYTVLKTGKIREKISVSLVRSGIDSGSFGKFSEGEAARVNLATILSMQKLINGNCDHEKGLDMLVLDEILESVDEDGLSSMFAALNQLGVTALVVSHGNVAESYPHKIKIVKEHGESHIEI